jgi:formylglycine-generating enzyme required for sulfatase activity
MPEEPLPGTPPTEPVVEPGTRTRGRRPGVAQLFEALEKQAPEQAKLLGNSVGMKFVLIPVGTFPMGSSELESAYRLNETPQHEITITQAFYIAVTLVTQAQYQRVMGQNPSRFHAGVGGSAEHPVERVSWDDAADFCRRLSEVPEERQAGRHYRLPTEAEWEYACRAGTSTPFCFGKSLAAAQANFNTDFPFGEGDKGRPTGKTTSVSHYPANNFGLYDVHGNLWEWCADWYDGQYYRHSTRRDPVGPSSGRFRVVRGGSWRNHAATCRAAYRNALVPNNRDPYTGFRVAITAAGVH